MRQQPILSTILPFLFILLFSLYWAASKDDTQTFVQCLKKKSENSTSITQIIYTTSNPSYPEILNRFIENLLFGTPDTPKPVAVVTPFHESHIQTAIYCSKKSGLEMRIRSGGNDIEGSSYVSNVPFIVLDMYGFRSISVNAKEKTVWSGAGATYGELYYAINQTDASLAFPGPYWPTVGVGGHICSGGFGGLIRKYGVGADNVVDARIINAKGEILDRKSMGKDLFWAIRGGSCASFGVVVAFKLKLVRIPKVIAVFNVKRTLEQDGAFLINKWQYIAPNLPRELMLSLQLTNVVLQNSTKQTVIANFIASFLGDIESLSSIMNRDFPELGLIQSDFTTVVGWAESTIYHLGVPLEQSVPTLLSRIPPEPIPYLKMQSDFFQSPIPKKGLKEMLDLLMQAPAGESFMEMSPLKGILDDIPESSIPFPHRKGNLFLIGERIAWFESGRVNAEKRLAWSRKFHKFLGKYVPNNPRSAFVNYRDYGLGVNHHINNANGDPTSVEQAKRSWGAPYFKDNFDRLVRVKTRVDPENFFNYEQSFPVLPLNSFKVGYARS